MIHRFSSNKDNEDSKIIKDFIEGNKPLTSEVTFCHKQDFMPWIFDYKGKLSDDPDNECSISFMRKNDSILEQTSTIFEMLIEYPSIKDEILKNPSYKFPFTKDQYFKITSESNETEIIKLNDNEINGALIKKVVDWGTFSNDGFEEFSENEAYSKGRIETKEMLGTIHTLKLLIPCDSINSPFLNAIGFKVYSRLEKNYLEYRWCVSSSNQNLITYYNNNCFSKIISLSDITLNNINVNTLCQNTNNSYVIFTYKIGIDRKSAILENNNDKYSHYKEDVSNFENSINFYNIRQKGKTINALYDEESIENCENKGIVFYPQIQKDGVVYKKHLEISKNNEFTDSNLLEYLESEKFHSQLPNDQSVLTYNVCKNMMFFGENGLATIKFKTLPSSESGPKNLAEGKNYYLQYVNYIQEYTNENGDPPWEWTPEEQSDFEENFIAKVPVGCKVIFEDDSYKYTNYTGLFYFVNEDGSEWWPESSPRLKIVTALSNSIEPVNVATEKNYLVIIYFYDNRMVLLNSQEEIIFDPDLLLCSELTLYFNEESVKCNLVVNYYPVYTQDWGWRIEWASGSVPGPEDLCPLTSAMTIPGESGQGDPNGTVINTGINILTEANRRYSSVVTTEPYMITRPLNDGQIVKCDFINSEGTKVKFGTYELYEASPIVYLRIKANKSYISAIDKELATKNKNTDIINTASIRDINTKLNYLITGNAYTNFRNYIFRQDMSCDEFVDDFSFFCIKAPDSIKDSYSNDMMKINGAGILFEKNNDGSDCIILNLYCSNYTPDNIIDSNTIEEIAPDMITIISEEFTSTLGNMSISKNEIFKPMIKLPGINGFIKIMSKNNYFSEIQCNDGDVIVTYNVEFPFCYGSLRERINFDFENNNYLNIQVLKMYSYINAGSYEINYNKIMKNNKRFTPVGDTLFCPPMLTTSLGNTELVVFNYNERKIQYPNYLIRKEKSLQSLWARAPIDKKYKNSSFNFEVKTDVPGDQRLYDHQLHFLVDNDLWYFNENYVSHINNEIPMFNFIVNLSTIINYVPITQDTGIGYVDQKRFLSIVERAISHMTDNNGNLLSSDTVKSNIVIEIWDSECNIGYGEKGSWRPLNVTSKDDHPAIDFIKYDNIVILNSEPFFLLSSIVYEIKSFTIGIYREDSIGVTQDDIDFFKTNKNLFIVAEQENMKSFRIIHYEVITVYEIKYIKLYVKIIDDFMSPLWDNYSIDPFNIIEPLFKLKIGTPIVVNSKSNINSIRNNQNDGTIVVYSNNKDYIDIRKDASIERYVDENNNILLRTRVVPYLSNEIYKKAIDENRFVWYGESVKSIPEGNQWPEYFFNPFVVDAENSIVKTVFNPDDIETLEQVKIFGLNNIKITSN